MLQNALFGLSTASLVAMVVFAFLYVATRGDRKWLHATAIAAAIAIISSITLLAFFGTTPAASGESISILDLIQHIFKVGIVTMAIVVIVGFFSFFFGGGIEVLTISMILIVIVIVITSVILKRRTK